LCHFTREIALNDEYLSHFLPDRKVLSMTLEQLFEIFIKLSLFDGSEQHAYCSGGKINFWSHLVRKGPKTHEQKCQESFPWLHRIDLKRRQEISESYINNMPKAFSGNTYFMSNLCSKKCHFTGKSIGDQPCTFLSFLGFEDPT